MNQINVDFVGAGQKSKLMNRNAGKVSMETPGTECHEKNDDFVTNYSGKSGRRLHTIGDENG